MTKKDLKNGMIVELRNGIRYLYCEGVLRGSDEWDLISNYTDDLKCPEFSRFDIIKVYKDSEKYNLDHLLIGGVTKEKLIWQRSKLSGREVEILKALNVIGFTHIARDKNENIFVYFTKPIKDDDIWVFNENVHPDETQLFKVKRDLFSFVNWKDKEPTSISNLLSTLNEGERK